jgi:hypothetical protein
LAGRADLLRQIADALARPHIMAVLLHGPSGVGKTRLAAESVTLATSTGRPVLRVSVSRTLAQIPLGAVPLSGDGGVPHLGTMSTVDYLGHTDERVGHPGRRDQVDLQLTGGEPARARRQRGPASVPGARVGECRYRAGVEVVAARQHEIVAEDEPRL